MLFPIVRKNGIPLYIQVKEAVQSEIKSGVWKTGDKLPTERELSERLKVSRNTVSQAYQELEAEGVLTSVQGRGTFVCDRDDAVRIEHRKELLLKIIDVAMEEGLQLGFTLDEFVELTDVRARQKLEFLSQVRVMFIECNREQVEYCYLDGRTRKRDAVITSFKDGGSPVFLISLKAGGFGLTLACDFRWAAAEVE